MIIRLICYDTQIQAASAFYQHVAWCVGNRVQFERPEAFLSLVVEHVRYIHFPMDDQHPHALAGFQLESADLTRLSCQESAAVRYIRSRVRPCRLNDTSLRS